MKIWIVWCDEGCGEHWIVGIYRSPVDAFKRVYIENQAVYKDHVKRAQNAGIKPISYEAFKKERWISTEEWTLE
jgi:hypothetical protein